MNTRQGGWIASFLIIGAVLMLGLVGTVYFVKTQRLNTDLADVDKGTSQSQAPENDTTTAEKDAADKKADEKKSDDTTKADDEKAASSSEQAPATPEQPSGDTADADDTEALPVTGPAETAVSLFVLSLVAFSVVSYTRSRSA